ncbi:MAG: Smr/MutS family protein [Sphingomicrobium sp.]
MRSLGAEEAALWARVTASIRPLSREIAAAEPDALTSPIETVRPSPHPIVPPARPKPVSSLPRPRLGTTLDGSWDKRLKSGAVEPDRTLDLHGHSLDRAWQALDLALDRAISAGDRLLLLVTGHERAGEPPIARGKIRAAVHDWLAMSRHASRIAAVRAAHRRHGGGGSLYIVLRKG